MDWIQAIQLVGVPMVILMAIASGFVRACNWCAPRIDRFLDGHQQLLDKTCELQEEVKALVVALGGRVADHDVLELAQLDRIESGVGQLSDRFDSTLQLQRKGA